jgi:hypothetical protein
VPASHGLREVRLLHRERFMRAHLLEGRANLQRMRQEFPLNDAEIAAVEDVPMLSENYSTSWRMWEHRPVPLPANPADLNSYRSPPPVPAIERNDDRRMGGLRGGKASVSMEMVLAICGIHLHRLRDWFSLTAHHSPPTLAPAKGADGAQAPQCDADVNQPLPFEFSRLNHAHPYLTSRRVAPDAARHLGIPITAERVSWWGVVNPIHDEHGFRLVPPSCRTYPAHKKRGRLFQPAPQGLKR